jgi:hypothetical protein
MFRREDGKPFLQKPAIESRVVGDYENHPAQQIVDGAILYAMTGDHLIGNAGNVRDLRRNRKAGIFEPLPGAENFIDPPALTVIFEQADAEFDDLVALGIDAGRLDIHDGGDELWAVIGWVVFGPRLQPTGDTILAALDERSGHLFERVLHTADMAKSKIAFN